MSGLYSWAIPGPRRRTKKKRRNTVSSAMPDSSSSFVCAMQLSIWDNIFGPRLENVWLVDTLSDDAQKYIARHTLAGEMTPSDPNMPSKFHVFPELELIVTALVFSAKHHDATARYSLAIVFHKRHLSRYLALHDLVEDRLLHITTQLMTLLNQPTSSSMEQFHGLLNGFITKLDALFESVLPLPNFEGTFFCSDTSYSRTFLEKAVTAHLQTHCCTVVSGDDLLSVNRFIDSLAIFLSHNERMRSCYARLDRTEYTPDLYLQGFVDADIDDESFIQSRLPTTLVNISTQTVRQARPYHEYTLLRTEYLKAEVKKLVDFSNPEIWSGHERLLRPVETSSPTVSAMLDVVFRLPMCLRQAYLTDSLSQLTRKSVVLVKYLESGGQVMDDTTLKRMRADLHLTNQSDFYILLALTEKISPGTYLDLAGDPLHMEERFVQLFESF